MHPRTRVVAAALLAAACSRTAPLDAAAIDAAESRWRAASVASYDMHVRIEGDRIDAGDFVVQVRSGQVQSVTRNGAAVSSRDAFYSVPGLFELLRDELEIAAAPQSYWGVAEGTAVRQRAKFHPELGYPERYLRAVSGTEHNIAITVKKLEPLP